MNKLPRKERRATTKQTWHLNLSKKHQHTHVTTVAGQGTYRSRSIHHQTVPAIHLRPDAGNVGIGQCRVPVKTRRHSAPPEMWAAFHCDFGPTQLRAHWNGKSTAYLTAATTTQAVKVSGIGSLSSILAFQPMQTSPIWRPFSVNLIK